MNVERARPLSATPDVTPASEAVRTGQDTAQRKRRGAAALQSRNFRLLWLGLITSNIGTWMASTAEGWLVTGLVPDRASVSLGMIAVSFAIPMLLLPPIGGAVADRMPRLRLLWIVQSLYLVLSMILAILTLSGAIAVWMLMGYAFLNGIVLAFDAPTRHALLPDIVTPEQLTSAVSLNSAAFTGAALLGPALAGVLIPVIGVGGVFLINALSGLAVLWALRQLRVQERELGTGPREHVGRSILAAVRYVRQSRLISGLLLVSIVTGIFGRSYSPLLAVFARDVFEVGSTGYGFLAAAPGFGTLFGAIWLATRGDLADRGRWIWRTSGGFALALFGFALVGVYGAAVPLLMIVGMTSIIASALIATLLQLHVPNELRGRVMSLYMLTVIGVPSAGALLSGVVASQVGVNAAVAGGAVIVLILTVIAFLRNDDLRRAP
jgi:MFS family permease